jgi:hypothetical protein
MAIVAAPCRHAWSQKKDVYRVGGRRGVDESRAARSLARSPSRCRRSTGSKIQDFTESRRRLCACSCRDAWTFRFHSSPRSIRLGSGPELLVRSLFPPLLQPDRVHHQCRDRCLWSRIYIYRPVHSIACLFPHTA